MSEMKLKCLVWSQTDRRFLNQIFQSNDLILLVLSQKNVSSEMFSSALLRKKLPFGNISMESVFSRGHTEMSSENGYTCKSHKPLQLYL